MRTTLSAKQSTGSPFPCHYHKAPEHRQLRLIWTYHRLVQPLQRQTFPLLATAKRFRRHRQRPPLRRIYTDCYSHSDGSPTLYLPTPDGPGVTATVDYFTPTISSTSPTSTL